MILMGSLHIRILNQFFKKSLPNEVVLQLKKKLIHSLKSFRNSLRNEIVPQLKKRLIHGLKLKNKTN